MSDKHLEKSMLVRGMTKFDPKVNTIHVDMDGVVADFDAYVMEKMGRTFDHQAGPVGDKEMWKFLESIPNLYFLLPPMPYAKELWEFVHSVGCPVKILTAIPRRTTMPSAEADKRAWFVKHKDIFGENVDVNIGPFSRDKFKHAKPGDILIDDRLDNISAWGTKGQGVGVYHKNLADTITLINEVLEGAK